MSNYLRFTDTEYYKEAAIEKCRLFRVDPYELVEAGIDKRNSSFIFEHQWKQVAKELKKHDANNYVLQHYT